MNIGGMVTGGAGLWMMYCAVKNYNPLLAMKEVLTKGAIDAASVAITTPAGAASGDGKGGTGLPGSTTGAAPGTPGSGIGGSVTGASSGGVTSKGTGVAGGSVLGGIIGSFLLPGAGTVIGSTAGGIIGGAQG